MTDAKEYTEEEIRDSFNSGYTCGMEQGEELGRKQTIDRVLEIVEFEKVDPKFVGGEGYEYLSYAAGWENCAHTIIDKVLSLKGEQE